MKWAIIGTSFISGVMAEAIRKDDKSTLYAVAGRTPTTLEEFAKAHKPTVIYNDYDALMLDPEVDIVYIALPNHLHHEFVIKAARAGKAILCEKSLSVDMEKTDQALDAVKEHQVFFAEGLMYQCHPYTAKVLELLASGVIGEIKVIQASYVAAIAQFVNPSSKGALYNLGCYPMSLAYLTALQSLSRDQLLDYQLSAVGRKGEDGNICESSATLRFADKINLQIHTAEDYGLKHGFSVLGTIGCITLDSNPWLPSERNTLTLEQYETSSKTITIDADGDAFYYQVRAIREAVENGYNSLRLPKPTPVLSRDVMQLLTDWEAAVHLNK